ncbi:MAG: hypothetical protein HN849_35160 [Victivallales bacterium]|nr:hypothetical protein [Victivallales bacterium]
MSLSPLLRAAILFPLALHAQTNRIVNGDFADGTHAPWHWHHEKEARATGGIDAKGGIGGSPALRVQVTAAQNANHVQLGCPFAAAEIETGQVYEVRFQIRAVPARACSVHILGARKPWTNAGLRQKVQATPEWREQVFRFRAKRPEQERVKLDFFLGDAVGETWLDNVSLRPFEPPKNMAVAAHSLASGRSRLGLAADGSVAVLTDVKTKAVLVGGIQPSPAFELRLEIPGQEGVDRSSSEARAVVTQARGPDAGIVTVYTFADMTVRTRVRPIPGGLFDFGLEVDNRSPFAVTGVRYPILHSPEKLGPDSADDRILYPRCDGGLIEDPRRTMGGQSLSETYPGPLSCQLMTYHDTQAGVYLATYDAAGHPKRFSVSMALDCELSVQHLFPIAPGKGIRIAYPTVLGVFSGDWYAAAEIYRRWTRKQPWCATPLSKRQDTPAWLKKGGIVTCYNPRARTKDGKPRFTDEGLRAFCDTFSRDFGLPAIPNNRGWEQFGEWCGQEYLPPYPDDAAFARQAGIIRDAGGQGMIMLSGWRWTIDKPLPGGTVHSNQERFDREIIKHVTHAADGKTPLVKSSTKENDWHGAKYARLCPATPFAEQTAVEVAAHCAKAGYPIIHFDQEVSGPASTSFCGHPGHGHAPGYGPWMHQAMARLYTRLRAECAPLNPDFALSMEEPNELYLPWLNLCQSRPNGITNEFPMRPPIKRVVPLFSYLYHDYLVGWVAFYPWRSAGRPRITVAKGFAAGMMPGLHIESTYRYKPEEKARFNAFLRACCEFYAGEGHEALLYGRMEAPLHIVVPQRTFNLGKRGLMRVPAVYHSLWTLPDGRRCVTLFNPETQEHRLDVPGVGAVVVPALGARLVPLPRI